MKKILSLMLALLMLALPVFSMAETAEATLAGGSFATKYLQEGQQLVRDVSIEPGFFLLANLPEDAVQPVTDLLNALKIEIVSQSSELGGQGALRLLLNDTNVADVTVAMAEGGLYATSNFLGGKIVKVTTEQLEQLSQQMMQQMVAQGQITQEQLDALNNGLASFQEDPQAAIASLIGNVDTAPLMAAAADLIVMGQPEEVTEIPEGVTIEAKYVMNVTIKKDALKNVTTEVAKLAWSMPIVQQIASSANSGEPLTEESLTAKLNSVADALAEDINAKVYMNEDQSAFYIDAPVALNEGDLYVTCEVTKVEDNLHVAWNIYITSDEQNVICTGSEDMTMTENGGLLSYALSVKADDGNVENMYEVENILMNAAWTRQDTVGHLTVEYTMTIRQTAEAEPVTVIFTLQNEEKDLGDHAEDDSVIAFSVGAGEEVYDVLKLNVNAKTAQAEAYIVSDDAVEILSLSEEEMNAFVQEITPSLMAGLFGLLPQLPESVQPFVSSMLGGMMQ